MNVVDSVSSKIPDFKETAEQPRASNPFLTGLVRRFLGTDE
jgi:hypothetical protein